MRRKVPSQPMQVNRCLHRPRHIIRKLRQHRGNNPRQNVPASTLRHRRIPCRIHRNRAIRMRHQRPPPLQHQRQLVLGRKAAGQPNPVCFHLFHAQPSQRGHLPRMRRQHHHPPSSIQQIRLSCEGVQRVRIDHHRQRRLLHHMPRKLRCIPHRRQPRPQRQHRNLLQQSLQLRCIQILERHLSFRSLRQWHHH